MVRCAGHTQEIFMREETSVANRTSGQVFHERRRLLGAFGLAGLGLFAGSVLEEGVGDVNFVVVAIDNAGDRAAYVGPIYSYYEFISPQRLTDEAWQQRIVSRQLPDRPSWTRSFQAPAVPRSVGP